jgi:hypothetical protein
MTEDTEDHISRQAAAAKIRFGRERTLDEQAEDFALHSPASREAALTSLRTPKSLNLLDASRRLAQERALRETDSKLRRAGR